MMVVTMLIFLDVAVDTEMSSSALVPTKRVGDVRRGN